MPGGFGLTIKSNRVPAVQSALRASALQAIAARRDEAVQVIRAYEHVYYGPHREPFYPGYMRAHTVGTVAVMRNDVATTAIVSEAPYSADEELGTVRRPGHRRIQTGAAAYRSAYGSRMGRDIGRAIEGAAR
jgi:hypothetical protein